jgi:hypothetical protein
VFLKIRLVRVSIRQKFKKGDNKMNGQKLFRSVLWGILAALLLVGCGASGNDQPVVTFDGSSCTYEGPSELTAGEHQFAVKNLSDGNLSLIIFLIEEGYTYQDVVNKVEEDEHKSPNTGQNWADWWSDKYSRFVTYEIDQTTGDELYTWEMRKEGDYALTVYNNAEETIWPCAPFKVVAAPSE